MRTRPILFVIPALLLAAGCAKDGPSGRTDLPDCEVALSVEGETPSAETRSVLPATDAFEKKISDVTVMAYTAAGILETAEYFSSTGTFTISLSKATAHTLYLFVNMGDLRGAAPKPPPEGGNQNPVWEPGWSLIHNSSVPPLTISLKSR